MQKEVIFHNFLRENLELGTSRNARWLRSESNADNELSKNGSPKLFDAVTNDREFSKEQETDHQKKPVLPTKKV